MKNIFILLTIAFIGLVSCDGRDRVLRTSQNDLIENKLLDTFTESIIYTPKAHTEVVTDTILANGFHVKINHFTDMNASITAKNKADTFNNNLFREFVGEIKITVNNVLIFNHLLNKDFLKKHLSAIDKEFLNTFILKNIRVNQLRSILDKEVFINFSYCHVDGKNCTTFLLHVNALGEYNIKQTNGEGC